MVGSQRVKMQVYKVVQILEDGTVQESFINTGMTEEEKIFKGILAEIIDLAHDARSKSANLQKNYVELLGNLPKKLDLDLVHYVDPRDGSSDYALYMSLLVPVLLMMFLYLSQYILRKEWLIRKLPKNIKIMAHRFSMANTALFRDNDINEDLAQGVAMILNYKIILMVIGVLLMNLHTTKLLTEWTSVPRLFDEIPNELNQTMKLHSYLSYHRRWTYQIYTKAQDIERVVAKMDLTDSQSVSYYHLFPQLERAFHSYYYIFVPFYKISLDHYGRHSAWLLSCIYFSVAMTMLFIKLWRHPDLRMKGVIHDIIGVAYIIIYGVMIITAYQMFLIPIYQENVHPDSSILACNFWDQLKLW